MVRFERSLIFGIVTLALSTATATVSAQEGAQGPPSNLKAGRFQSVVDGMWRDSATFRQQCLRLGAQGGLIVTVTADWPRPEASSRAKTTIMRKGRRMFADIVLQSPYDRIELIAHEIEHVIEQLDGVKLRTTECEGSRNPPGVYESCRAVEAGRRVAREVEEARAVRAIASSEGASPARP
jgi:hypothetical protein